MSPSDRAVISTSELYDQYRALWELEPGEYADRLNALWLGLVQSTGDAAIALHAGATAMSLETPLAGVLLTSVTAWDALRRCFQVMRKMNVRAQYGFLESGSEVSVAVEYFLPVEPLGYDSEFKLAMLLNLARTLTNPQVTPVQVEFRGPAPAYVAEVERYFGAPVHYGSPGNRITFDRATLERPFGQVPAFYEDLGRKIEQACAHQAERSEAALRVRGLVMQSLGEGYGGMKSLAPKLGVSSRTLQRRLQQDGTTYQELLDASRKRLCLSYMRSPKRSLAEIAGLLGYANMPNFHRAFKRWFGVSPARFRRRLRGLNTPESRRGRRVGRPQAVETAVSKPGESN